MKSINLGEIPDDYKDLYANKIFLDIVREKLKYDDKTIKEVIDYFILNEEYEKCEKIKNELNDNK